MDPSPLPPHERAWRHPSELGAPAHEPTTTGGRILILSTATFSLLLVGLLAISMTPDRAGTPEAVGSTVSGVRAIPVSALTRVSLPMVTPVGSEGMGLTTLDALGADARWIEARLPSGEVVQGEVVATSGGLALVELPAAMGTEGLDLAEDDPTPDDTVMVHSAEPVVVSVADINTLHVDEGTPVTDAEGRLVGLCTGDDVMQLRLVASLPATAPQPVPTVAITAAPSTTIVATTDPPSTVAPSTTSTTSSTAAATTPASPPSVEPAEDGADGERRGRGGGSLSGGDDGASD